MATNAEAVQRLRKFLDSILDTDEYNAVFEMLGECIDLDDDISSVDKAGKIDYIAKLPNIGILADKRKAAGDSMADRETVREIQALRQAEVETGIVGMDSVGATYRAALRQMGKDSLGMDVSAARAVYRALKGAPQARVAMDSQAQASRVARFPHGDRLLKSSY